VLIKDGRMKPDGQIIIVGEGPVVEHDTKQCCHCGGHFIIRRGSGVRRGWCTRCQGVTCGGERCWECRPHAKLVAEGTR
jgi:hypothetical protein